MGRGQRKKREKGQGKRRRSLLRRLVIAVAALTAVLLLGAAATAGGALWYYGRDLPDLSDLRDDYRPPQISRIETRDGVLIGEIFDERRTVVPFDRIPRVLINAVLAAEDADFYEHRGLDYPGMIRALFINLREGRIAQGASTITQQVVQTFYIGRERTFARKIRELLLARRLEQHLTKDEILFLYLNQINFGHARYGVQQASRYYFGRDVERITLAQAALLAGLPRGPAVYSPRIDPQRAIARRNWVLSQMEAKGMVSAAEVAAARETPLDLASRSGDEALVPEIVDRVRRELVALVGEDEVRLGGYRVRTTIDARLQRAARRAVQDGLRQIDERHGYRGPLESRRGDLHRGPVKAGRGYLGRVVGADDPAGTFSVAVHDVTGVIRLAEEERYNPQKLPASRFAVEGAHVRVRLEGEPRDDAPARLRLDLGPQGALVALEPGTGRVLALVGGYTVRQGDFDRASQARRQPGSSFKPFVYSFALNSRQYTPASLIADAPEVFEQWRPRNFEEWSYEGHVRLRTGLAKSINMVAIKLIRDLGPENVVAYAHQLGIESPLEATPTLALGASAVTPLEMAGAYAVFASGGLRAPPRLIEEIRRPDDRVVALEARAPERVLDPPQAYLISSMLRSVVREGTASDAHRLGDDLAGKTGTSDDAQDAWFVGFALSPAMVCAVWVGFDEPRSLGRRESGSRAALPIWIDFMEDALRNRARPLVERPEGVVTAQIDPATGLLAYEGQLDALEEEFLDGTVPTESAVPPDAADPSTFVMEETGEGATQ
jgi:penicillin-binding protein 1A